MEMPAGKKKELSKLVEQLVEEAMMPF